MNDDQRIVSLKTMSHGPRGAIRLILEFTILPKSIVKDIAEAGLPL